MPLCTQNVKLLEGNECFLKEHLTYETLNFFFFNFRLLYQTCFLTEFWFSRHHPVNQKH